MRTDTCSLYRRVRTAGLSVNSYPKSAYVFFTDPFWDSCTRTLSACAVLPLRPGDAVSGTPDQRTQNAVDEPRQLGFDLLHQLNAFTDCGVVLRFHKKDLASTQPKHVFYTSVDTPGPDKPIQHIINANQIFKRRPYNERRKLFIFVRQAVRNMFLQRKARIRPRPS